METIKRRGSEGIREDERERMRRGRRSIKRKGTLQPQKLWKNRREGRKERKKAGKEEMGEDLRGQC